MRSLRTWFKRNNKATCMPKITMAIIKCQWIRSCGMICKAICPPSRAYTYNPKMSSQPAANPATRARGLDASTAGKGARASQLMVAE